MAALRCEYRVPRTCFVPAPHEEWSDTDMYPDAAIGAPADDRKADCSSRTPDKATQHRDHASDAHEPRLPSHSDRPSPPATALALPESGHTGLCLALSHYPNPPTKMPDEPPFYATSMSCALSFDGHPISQNSTGIPAGIRLSPCRVWLITTF